MKLKLTLLLIVSLLTLNFPPIVIAAATPAHIQSVWCQDGGGNVTSKNCDITPTPGNTLIVHCYSNASDGGYSVADNKGNSYTVDASASRAGISSALARASNISGTGAYTVTCSKTGVVGFMNMMIAEYSGLDNSSPVDIIKTGSGTSANPTTSGSSNTTNATDLLVGAFAESNGSNLTLTAGSGYTLRQGSGAGTSIFVGGIEDRNVTSTGNYQGNFTYSDTAGTWSALMVAYKASGSTPPPPDTTAPSVPTNFSATAVSSSAINLSWTASTDAVGVTGYKIYRAGVQVGTSATNSYSDTGLSASTQYSYTVLAYDAANNNSAQSSSASATTQAPAVVLPTLIVSSVSGNSGTNVDLPVALTSSTAGVAGLQFDLTITSPLTLVFSLVGSSSSAAGKQLATSTVAGNLRVLIFGFNANVISPGEVAVIRLNIPSGTASGSISIPISGVVFTDAGGMPISGGTNTNGSVTVTPAPDTTAPSVPTNLSATAVSSSAINLSWTASTDAVGVTGYKIYRAGVQVGTSATNSYSDTGLSASTQYSYTVLAYDAANNNSAQSSSASATTQAAPPQGTYLWSNIIAQDRATDWSTAGVVGGIPNRTTRCGNVIAAYNGTAATINTAISNCPAGQYVELGAGTFNLTTGIDITKSNITVRGAGAGSTFLNMSGLSNASCHWGLGRVISLCTNGGNNIGVDNSVEHSANWTAGYTHGGSTSVITLSNTTGLSVGSTIWLDQLDDTADYPGSGDVRVCEDPVGTCSNHSGGEDYVRVGRGLTEGHVVTAINGLNVTVEPGIYMPTFRASQSPGAWWGNSGTILQNTGIENLSVNLNAIPGAGGIYVVNGTNVWIKGVRIMQPNTSSTNAYHISTLNCVHCSFVDNYLYGPPTSQLVNIYGFALHIIGASLIQNNILHKNSAPLVLNSAVYGNSISYNYFDEGLSASIIEHGTSGMNLMEGNNGTNFSADVIQATHHFTTLFRNHFDGYTHNTDITETEAGLSLYSRARFYNSVGNVFGHSHWTTYQTLQAHNQDAIFELGWQGTGSGTAVPNDARVAATLLRWGNWDNVTSSNDNGANDLTGTRFVSSEVPSNITNYLNFIPSSQVLPSSFYISSQPSWWTTPFGTPKWPAVGPDVSNGNISNSPTGGHADKIPARLCFENSTNDPAFASTNPRVKLFNAASCYGTSGGGGDTTPPSVPTNLSATAISSSAINLSWTASTDVVGVTGYKIYRGGTQIGTSVSNSYSDTGLNPSVLYSYTVSAYDAAGNNSSQSTSASATTQSGQPVPGDLNSDHIVNALDYSLLNSKWLQNFSSYDLQVDGLINSLDFAILSSNWGRTW